MTRPVKPRRLLLLVLGLALACGDDTVGDGGHDALPDADSDGALPDGRLVDAATAAQLTVTPAMQSFGDVALGETSGDASFIVTSAGTSPSAALTGSISGDSTFTIASSTCAGALAAAATCAVSVRFAPTSVGGARASLNVSDGSTNVSVALEGNGIESDDRVIAISPTPFNFGATSAGTRTAAQSFAVLDFGGGTSELTITLRGVDSTQFILGANACSGMSLASGGSCTVEVLYSPTSAGSHFGILEASASGSNTTTAALFGTATLSAALQLDPGTQDFGSVSLGTSSTGIRFTLTNTGGAPTDVLSDTLGGDDGAEFEITTSTCTGVTLAAGASCVVTVRFNAGTPGVKTGTLDVTDGALSTSASLSATSVYLDANVIISPTSHDYGPWAVGAANAMTYTVTNTGAPAIGPLSVTVGGANPGDFAIERASDGCTGVSLPGGGECTLAVRFSPIVAGGRSATLRVLSTTAALIGTGTTPAFKRR